MITVIIGFTGQGKSTLAAFAARRSDTRVFFDPRRQFNTTDDILPDSSGLYDLLDDRYEVVIQPGRGEELTENFDRTCSAIADWIEDNPQEKICLIADEGRLLALYTRTISLNFDWILRSAREGSPIDVIITCHRPVDVHPDIRAIANRLVFFRVMLPNDLAVIEDQCGPEVEQQVSQLQDREYIVWNNSRQQWKKVTDPQTWYVNIDKKEVVSVNA